MLRGRCWSHFLMCCTSRVFARQLPLPGYDVHNRVTWSPR
jgi:hypothetical protein